MVEGVGAGRLFEVEEPGSESGISWYAILDAGKVGYQGHELGR